MIPDKKYGWFVVGTTVANQGLTMGILLSGFALFVIPWVDEFQVSRSQVLLGSTLVLVVNSLLSPLGGKLMDSISLRKLILVGVMCLSAGLALVAFATSFWMILLAYSTLLPASLVLCGSLSSQTLVSKWFTQGRGNALGISALGSSAGGFLLPAVISILIASYSWRQALLVLSILSLILLFPLNGMVLRREPPDHSDTADDSQNQASGPIWTTAKVVRKPMFWIPVTGFIPLMAGYTGVQFNLGAYMADLGYEQGLAAKLIISIAVGQVIGKLGAGSLSERLDHRMIYWAMAGTMAVSLFLYSGSPSAMSLYAASVLMGAATGAVLPMIPIVYSARFGTRSIGVVLGIVVLVMIVGSFGSLFAGLIYDATESYETAFWIFGGLLVPASVLVAFMPTPEKAQSAWPQEKS